MDTLIKLIKQNKFKAAERFLRAALEKEPNDVYLLTQLANVLWNRHKDEEALAFADKAKDAGMVMPLLCYTRGRILWSLERYEQSVEEWNAILNMPVEDVADKGFGTRWARSVVNDARYYKADCLYHLFQDKDALALMEAHLEHRERGLQSDFTKKEAVVFYKILKYSHPRTMAKTTDAGYASAIQRKRILKRLDALEAERDWKRLVGYLKTTCRRYPNEYFLKTILSEYCIKAGDNATCLEWAKAAFSKEPNDTLVKYNYAVALMTNGIDGDVLSQFEEIMALGPDCIAYSEHGEGTRWARKILRDTQRNIQKLKQ